MSRATVLALLAVCSSGCQKATELLGAGKQELKSSDGTLAITVPGDWTDDSSPSRKLNDQAVLQASKRSAELYVIVLTEAKEDLADMDLAKFSETTRASQLQAMKNAVEEGPKKRTINGMPAIEYVLRGTVDKANIVMKHVSVDGAKRYHQLLVWTLKSAWDEQQGALDKVVESLKESGGGGSGARAPPPN